jgi:hypothetical protein
MKQAFILFLLIGLKLQAQSPYNNRLSFQTGLFHYFFDDSRLMNTGKYQWLEPSASKPATFNSSFSVNYQHQMPTKRLVNFEISNYKKGYVYPTSDPDLIKFKFRSNRDLNVCFLTAKTLQPKLNLCYGAGPSMRFSFYYQDTASISQPSLNFITNEFSQFSLGANSRISLEYSPVKWLTLFTQMQFAAFVYVRNGSFFSNKLLFDPYFKPAQFNVPSRFDLSLRFGAGINF